MKTRSPIWTFEFVLVSFISFAFFVSFYFLLPVLPGYILKVGGTDRDVGLILGVFTITATALRPFVGRGVDRVGTRLFIIAGTAVFLVAPLLYVAAASVLAILVVRIFHGTGIAFFTTSSSAYVAHVSPAERRGEAVGYYGMFSNVSMAIAPTIGLFLLKRLDYAGLFLSAAAMGGVAVLMSLFLRPVGGSTAYQRTGTGGKATAPGPAPGTKPPALIHPGAVYPSLVLIALTATYGVTLSFLPLYGPKRDFEQVGLFFTVYAAALIISRSVGGVVADRYGRGKAIAPGMGLAAVAMFCLAAARGIPAFLGVAAIYGTAMGFANPALMALAIDRAGPGGRGSAMGTFTAAFDLGIGLGSVFLGLVADKFGYSLMYVVAGIVAASGLAAFGLIGQAEQRRERAIEGSAGMGAGEAAGGSTGTATGRTGVSS